MGRYSPIAFMINIQSLMVFSLQWLAENCGSVDVIRKVKENSIVSIYCNAVEVRLDLGAVPEVFTIGFCEQFKNFPE